MALIAQIKAYELLDSRGRPSLALRLTTDTGIEALSMLPSGASTGKFEAYELRDKDPKRFAGLGLKQAIANIEQIIFPKIKNYSVFEQENLDNLMLSLDASDNQANLGANSILAVSMAIAKAAALSLKQPLFLYLAQLAGVKDFNLPHPMINLINGGMHADNALDIQEYMVVPFASSFAEDLRYGAEVLYSLKSILKQQSYSINVGDEGGFAPNLRDNKEALDLLSQAIEQAGFKLGSDFKFSLDCAASAFYKDGKYHLLAEKQSFTSLEFIDYLYNLSQNYPCLSIEDGLAENDPNWAYLTEKLKIKIIGDDLFVTNPKLLAQGIEHKLANAILIKPNQIGSITATLDCIKLAKNANFTHIVSHRSGDTEDTFIADLALGTASPFIKTGALVRSERVAKYNRLLILEADFICKK